MNLLRQVLRALVALIVAVGVAMPTGAVAQTSGGITGTAVDTSGGAIVDAAVTLLGANGSVRGSATTDALGMSSLSNVPPGRYVVRVQSQQFAEKRLDVEVDSSAPATVRVVLAVLAVRETVDVLGRFERETVFPMSEDTAAMKSSLPPPLIPQSVQVVPRAVMTDQHAMTLTDAVRTVAGVASDFGFNGSTQPLLVTPTMTFKECPRNLDVLFVSGGVPGTLAMMDDPEVLGFLAEQGKTATYVTSVCTGSLILGAAGLLQGYKATSHWSTRDVLKVFGATPTEGRVVTDRKPTTGGGVTAGLDFGLTLAAKLRNRAYAEAVQLYLEYDPHPPFNGGSPKIAGRKPKQFRDDMFAPMVGAARDAAVRAQKRLG